MGTMPPESRGGRIDPPMFPSPPDPDGGRVAPVPTCGAICAHLIGSCVPGAGTDKCVTDCEDGRNRFVTTCPVELDVYLRCMGTARVECHGTEVVVVDCSDERN